MAIVDDSHRGEIDRAIQSWQQGDCVLGEHWFLFRIDIGVPLTDEAETAAREDADAAEARVLGLMIATQTCDVVRSCAERPFVEACPLVRVDAGVGHDVARGRRPRYAFVPGMIDHRLVGDLDRVMTLEKAVVARWDRVAGCRTDDERRRLAQPGS